MNTAENIRNALQVLYKTYENVNYLMSDCRAAAEDCGYFNASDKFLRVKSDRNTNAWLLNDFILLFQQVSDPDCPSGNGWKEGPLYTLEICLGVADDAEQLPTLFLSAFHYTTLDDWRAGCSPAEHWGFFDPVHQNGPFLVRQEGAYRIAQPATKTVQENYWDLVQVITRQIPLLEVTAENMRQQIFGTFDTLRTIHNA